MCVSTTHSNRDQPDQSQLSVKNIQQGISIFLQNTVIDHKSAQEVGCWMSVCDCNVPSGIVLFFPRVETSSCQRMIASVQVCIFFIKIYSQLSLRQTPQGPALRACLHGGGGPQVGEVKYGGSPHLSCKRDQIKMRDYMDKRVTPPKRVTSPTWGSPPPCKQALSLGLR